MIEAAAAANEVGAIVLTLALDRVDGIERVVFRLRIDAELVGTYTTVDPGDLIERLRPWIEREFEMVREAALKSIRSERKLYEITFDKVNRGPFQGPNHA
jgi:hypothetical protein